MNTSKKLSELFEALTKPEFTSYTKADQDWFISALKYYLATDDNFDSTFYLFDTYFDDEISDQRQFMKALLKYLTRYQAEVIAKALD